MKAPNATYLGLGLGLDRASFSKKRRDGFLTSRLPVLGRDWFLVVRFATSARAHSTADGVKIQ